MKQTVVLKISVHLHSHSTRYLPAANYEWTQLRLQDFKTVSDYNHAVHRIWSKLQFCEKEPTNMDKIEKTMSTMLLSERILQQQYRERRFQVYSELIRTLLRPKNILNLWFEIISSAP